MPNCGKLDCNIYLDAYDDPTVWAAPKLTTQLDSLTNLMYRTSRSRTEKALSVPTTY